MHYHAYPSAGVNKAPHGSFDASGTSHHTRSHGVQAVPGGPRAAGG